MLARSIRTLRSLFRRDRLDREISTELDFHLEMQIEQLVRRGVAPDEARRRALRDFGGVDRVIEEIRDVRGITFWDALAQDVRYGLRALAANPGFALVAVVTLGLGIGANSAIFSVIDGVLLKPLPYREGSRLVLVRESAPLDGQDNIGVSIKEVQDYRQQLTTLQSLVEYHSMSFILLSHGEPDRVDTGVVSANFFDVLGVKPLLGRSFVDADDDLGAEPVLILSYGYWQRKFGGDPHIVGTVFQMNDRPHTVVGVLPNIPQYPRENDVYMPTSACPFRASGERRMNQDRRAFSALLAFGRVKPGVSLDEVETDVRTVAGRFRQEYPKVYPVDSGFTATSIPLQAELVRQARPMLLILFGTAALVLLIACANVANLTLARTLRREREFAVRAALGAGRGRLLRQLLTESTILAVVGGVLGLLLAWLTLGMLTAFAGRFTTRTMQIGIDGWVLAFTGLVSILTGLVFGTIPAMTSRVRLAGALKDGALQNGEGVRRHRLRSLLIVGQVAVSFALLVGAGLLLASFYRLEQVDPGFSAERVLTAEIFPNWSTERNDQQLHAMYRDLLGRLETQPGVLSAAITNAVPLAQLRPFNQPFRIWGRPAERPERRPTAALSIASPDYFATLGVPLLQGRLFTDLDHEKSARIAVINQTMARYWNEGNPLGAEVTFDDEHWVTIVGVVGNVRQFGLERDVDAQIYVPLSQSTGELGARLLVRTASDPGAMASTMKQAVYAVDPEQPVEQIQTLLELKGERLATPRLTATLLLLFAGLALVITVAGLTGVIATSVSQRTREFGIRMALGATRARVLRLVLRQGLVMVLAGLAIGAGGSFAFGQVLSSYLFRTEPTDPMTFMAVSLVFVACAVGACLVPARRATTIDPTTALRAE
jgi:predicted permease